MRPPRDYHSRTARAALPLRATPSCVGRKAAARRPCDVPTSRAPIAWIRAVSPSLLPCHGCRSGTGYDRAPADTRRSSRASAWPKPPGTPASVGDRARSPVRGIGLRDALGALPPGCPGALLVAAAVAAGISPVATRGSLRDGPWTGAFIAIEDTGNNTVGAGMVEAAQTKRGGSRLAEVDECAQASREAVGLGQVDEEPWSGHSSSWAPGTSRRRSSHSSLERHRSATSRAFASSHAVRPAATRVTPGSSSASAFRTDARLRGAACGSRRPRAHGVTRGSWRAGRRARASSSTIPRRRRRAAAPPARAPSHRRDRRPGGSRRVCQGRLARTGRECRVSRSRIANRHASKPASRRSALVLSRRCRVPR
jgi:hypothetical protein